MELGHNHSRRYNVYTNKINLKIMKHFFLFFYSKNFQMNEYNVKAQLEHSKGFILSFKSSPKKRSNRRVLNSRSVNCAFQLQNRMKMIKVPGTSTRGPNSPVGIIAPGSATPSTVRNSRLPESIRHTRSWRRCTFCAPTTADVVPNRSPGSSNVRARPKTNTSK